MSGLALALFANPGGGGSRRSSSCIDSMACVPDLIVNGLSPKIASRSIRMHPNSGGLSLGSVQMAPLRWSQGSMRAKQYQGGEYTMKMPSFKQTILLVGTPAILAVGGLTAMAAASPAPTTTPAPTQQSTTAPEPAETADAAVPGTAAEPAATAGQTAGGAPPAPPPPGAGHAY